MAGPDPCPKAIPDILGRLDAGSCQCAGAPASYIPNGIDIDSAPWSAAFIGAG